MFDFLCNKLYDWLDDLGNWPNGFISPLLYDPFVLDLNNDGVISLINANSNEVYFDHDCDGVAFRSSWIGADDGIVVLDRNDNGIIDDGSELFGNFTRKSNGFLALDGLDALADLNQNLDDEISAKDDKFALLKVWQDKNSNGLVKDGELKTLSELQITSLSLNTKGVNKIKFRYINLAA